MTVRFSKVLIAVGVLVVSIIAWYIISGIMHQAKVDQISERVDAINFSASLENKQCAGGGADTSEWCTYTLHSTKEQALRDLSSAGYSIDQEHSSSITMSGGNPKMTIYLRGFEDGNKLRLEAKILEGGRTI